MADQDSDNSDFKPLSCHCPSECRRFCNQDDTVNILKSTSMARSLYRVWKQSYSQHQNVLKPTGTLINVSDDSYLRNEYTALRSLVDGMDAVLQAPHRLRPDLADLRDGPLAEFWRSAPKFRRHALARMRSGYAEDERRATAGIAGTEIEDAEKESDWSDEQHAVDIDEWEKQFAGDDSEDDDDADDTASL